MIDKQLYSYLIEYLAVANSHFNSGFVDDVTYTDASARQRSVLMHNWFLPPKLQFPLGFKTEIGQWNINPKVLANHADFHIREYGKRPHCFPTTVLFLPKTLKEHWDLLTLHLGPPEKIYTGYLTPSGRSFWVLGSPHMAFGLKFHVTTDANTDAILNRTFDKKMIENTVETSLLLKDYPDAISEDYGLFLEVKKSDSIMEFGFAYRNFKWDLLQPQMKDIFLPMPVLLSHSFWKAKEVLRQLSLPDVDDPHLRPWFAEQLAASMSSILTTALFETGLHPEVHQQNLTVHLRNGEFINLIYHDHQDCLQDPITRFLLQNNVEMDDLNFSSLRIKRQLALPGEILTPDNRDKLFVSLSDWWRRWLRVFGRYDRILNILWSEDPFRDSLFEDSLTRKLKSHLQNMGLALEHSEENSGLYAWIAYAQYHFQQKLLRQFLKAHRHRFKKASALDVFSHGTSLASSRAPWTPTILKRWQEEHSDHSILVHSHTDGTFMFLESSVECHLYFQIRADACETRE